MASAKFFLDPEEKADLEAQALAENISLSLLVYRRVMGKPDAVARPVGRPKSAEPPKARPNTDKDFWGMTG